MKVYSDNDVIVFDSENELYDRVTVYTYYSLSKLKCVFEYNHKRDILLNIQKIDIAYAAFDDFIKSVMHQYSLEDLRMKKYCYEPIWFVDTFNNNITMYSDMLPFDNSSAIMIKRNDEDIEIFIANSKVDLGNKIVVTNDNGRYGDYMPAIRKLYTDLLEVVPSKDNTKSKSLIKVR